MFSTDVKLGLSVLREKHSYRIKIYKCKEKDRVLYIILSIKSSNVMMITSSRIRLAGHVVRNAAYPLQFKKSRILETNNSCSVVK